VSLGIMVKTIRKNLQIPAMPVENFLVRDKRHLVERYSARSMGPIGCGRTGGVDA
jgi:hypothetical protein